MVAVPLQIAVIQHSRLRNFSGTIVTHMHTGCIWSYTQRLSEIIEGTMPFEHWNVAVCHSEKTKFTKRLKAVRLSTAEANRRVWETLLHCAEFMENGKHAYIILNSEISTGLYIFNLWWAYQMMYSKSHRHWLSVTGCPTDRGGWYITFQKSPSFVGQRTYSLSKEYGHRWNRPPLNVVFVNAFSTI